eukprot:6011881-Pyramimonas_sp.AAC.1
MAPRPQRDAGDRSRSARATAEGPRSWHVSSDAEREAGASLLRHFLSLYGQCKMTAKDFCI